MAATLGSLLWAGCASDRTYYGDASSDLRPINLTERRADTHPEQRTASENLAGWDQTTDAPNQTPTIIESAGAQRPR